MSILLAAAVYVAAVGFAVALGIGPPGRRSPQRTVAAVVVAVLGALAPGLALVEVNRRSEGIFCDVDATCAAPTAGSALVVGLAVTVLAVVVMAAGVAARWSARLMVLTGGLAVLVLLGAVVLGVQYDVVVPRP